MTDPEFCQDCGNKLEKKRVDDRDRSYCQNCDQVRWKNPKPAAGVIVRDGEEVLLVKRGIEPSKGKWSIPAGFQEYDEPPEKAAARELEEETGIEADGENLELCDTVFMEQPGRGYVHVTVYLISAEKTTGEPEAGDDAKEAEYWIIENLENSKEEIREPYIEPVRKALNSEN